MNSNDLFDIIGETPERYVLDAANANAKVIPMRKRSPKRMWLIAAIIALILCLVGCAVAYVLSLDGMILGTEFIEDRTGETEPRTSLSLQGYVGSPSYQAAKEWFDFLQTYDPDGAIEFSDEADNVEFPEDYQFYHLYSVEMKEKLDAICQKYSLELLGPMIVDTTTENMFHELGINGVLREGAQAEVEWSTGSPGYFFRNGTFDVEFGVTLTGENNPWPYENVVFFRCHNKSSFDAVFLSMADPTQFEEWNYTTSAGVEVLLVMGPDGALIVADIGDYFITVGGIETKAGNILDGEHTMTREGLEAYAEIFDFSIQPRRLTDEQVSAVNSRYDAHWAEIEAKQKEQNEKFQEYLGQASYDARVKFHLERDTEATRMGYTFYDFDGNGVKELVIGRDGYIEYIYTEKDEETAAIIGWPNLSLGVSYLATDGTLVNISDTTCRFFHVENGERISDYWIEIRSYWGHSDESPWRLCYSVDDDRPITEEEYYQYCNSKERVVLDMLPLTDYPLPEPANYNTDGRDVTLYNTASTYEEMIRNYIINPVELQPGVFSEPKYALLDLDHDGQEELIIDEETYRAVYTMIGGKLVCLYSGASYYDTGLNICRGNVIEIIHSYSGDNKVYCYYRMSGTTGEMVEYLRYDTDRNPQNPWFRSSDATGQDISLVPISKAEFDRIRQTYAHIELDWKPVADYPLS
ncbi:MAG: hypothetical protein J6C92_14385 [Bacteroidaceae bacterium]|nr:hypothetical protein [Bacteroidaceae bacterium]